MDEKQKRFLKGYLMFLFVTFLYYGLMIVLDIFSILHESLFNRISDATIFILMATLLITWLYRKDPQHIHESNQ